MMQSSENQPIELIVGLANPGKQYANTRHNAGAWFIEALAEKVHAKLHLENKYHGLYAKVSIEGRPCHLLIPSTYMNLSGQAVAACMKYHKISPTSILIAHDEIDLPAGTVKLKFDGGDGGHNGVKDIIRHLNTRQFYRLRIGVSRPPTGMPTEDYVLHPPSKADHAKISESIELVEDNLELIMNGSMQQAMLALHTKK